MKLFFIFLINLSLSIFAIANDEMNILTSSGDVTGIKKNNVIKYEDIPYARAPVGDLRWKAPRKITSSSKIFPKENNFCIQRPSNLGGADGDYFYVGTEDCLYLDIFTPKEIENKNLPVMFWIHGGGNTSGLKDLYDFSKMVSKHNVIVVRINYRLGPFGWFTHPAIQNYQKEDDRSSNFGTLDIIMALRWVNENIEKFGGNPNNVTVFGESAGGHNVLSLLASKKAKGLFHKAISMSGYTTSISLQDAHKPLNKSVTSRYSSEQVVKNLIDNHKTFKNIKINDYEQIREALLDISSEDFFKIYAERESYEELPLLTADGIVIPLIGLKDALSRKEHVNIVPTIAGSNRDEVKLWLASARYFVDLKYSFFGSILGVPKVKLSNEASYEAFNYYRSSAWKIRGVDTPLKSLSIAGNKELYAYRYDWDDHRKYLIGNFQELIGAAHATEIPLLTGNNKLVGDYGFFIYPKGPSKRFTSKNMMKFWTHFAKTGSPGSSSNGIKWNSYFNEGKKSYLIIDKKKNMKVESKVPSFKTLVKELAVDNRVNELEKCIVLFQMGTYVGLDIYSDLEAMYPNQCNVNKSIKFLEDNASFIDY